MRIIPRTGHATWISVGRTDHGHAVVVAPDARWPCFCLECSSSTPRACHVNDWFLAFVMHSPRDHLGLNAEIAADAHVRTWQCALAARIISGGGFHLDNYRLGPEAGERLGWVTGWAGASRQRSPLGG